MIRLRVLPSSASETIIDMLYTVHFTAPVSTVLSVEARNEDESLTTLAGVTLRYTLDGVPMSPDLSGPYTWTWTPGALAGVHTVSVELVGNPPGYLAFPTVVFGSVVTGTQELPVCPAFTLAGTNLADARHWSGRTVYAWDGFPKDPAPYPFPVKTVLPSQIANKDTVLQKIWNWTIEPLTGQTHDYAEAVPRLRQRPSGQVWATRWYQQASLSLESPAHLSDNVVDDLRRDGPRPVGTVSPFVTFVPDVDSAAWYGVELNGRVFRLDPDGTVTTIAGPRRRPDGVLETVGDWPDGPLKGPNDIRFDDQYQSPSFLYVADTENHRIVKIDRSGPVSIARTLAGLSGSPGYADGPVASARFNRPYSLVVHGPHVYVSDYANGAIRKIDESTGQVTTVAGGPSKLPTRDQAYQNPLAYAPPSVAVADAAVSYPVALRFDSAWNLVWCESYTTAIRRLNWQASAIERITLRPAGQISYGDWIWLDVDKWGNVGPIDDVLFIRSQTSDATLIRIAKDGSRAAQMYGDGPLAFGPGRLSSDEAGHYAWAVAVHNVQARMVTSGAGSVGIHGWRARQSDDYPRDPYQESNPGLVDTMQYVAGKAIHKASAWAWRHGFKGDNRLGLSRFDELADLGDPDLQTYFLANVKPGGSTTEFNQWAYYVRLTSIRGSLQSMTYGVDPGPRVPPPPPPPPPQDLPPTAPTGLTASVPHTINLSWMASTDDVGVATYKVFRDGALIATIVAPAITYQDSRPQGTYVYTVRAVDTIGQESLDSTPLSIQVG